MNAIPYFDYSMAPFWPSYQNKIVGVLNRALREQSCSRVRRILLRLPWALRVSRVQPVLLSNWHCDQLVSANDYGIKNLTFCIRQSPDKAVSFRMVINNCSHLGKKNAHHAGQSSPDIPSHGQSHELAWG
nr:hypothetical protein [Escherichia coli]